VEIIQTRTKNLANRAEDALLQAFDAIKAAKDRGATDADLTEARALHRKAQWRADFVQSENSRGFHAPQEAARALGEAIDYARQCQIEAMKVIGK
jgi:nitrite reductase (cytochrome c-552)